MKPGSDCVTLDLCHEPLGLQQGGDFLMKQERFFQKETKPKKRRSFLHQPDFQSPASLRGADSNFLHFQLLLTHGWVVSSLLCAHCSASVCLSKVQSQTHLAINKYVSTLSASLIIIITPELEGWHSHWAAWGPDPAGYPVLFISICSKESGGQEGITGLGYLKGDFFLFSLKF